jgi:hypothetical protein
VLGFVSPTCGICRPLLPAFAALAATQPADEGTVLVVDAEADRAAEYLHANNVRLPFIAEAGALRENNIPGTPFVVVADGSGIVLSSGGVNSLEQIESLARDDGVAGAAATNGRGQGHDADIEAVL